MAFTPTSKLFRERYQSTLGADFPIVAYLRPDGGVVYFADRNTLPTSGAALFQEMKAAAFLARNAKPSTRLPVELDVPSALQADCPDGSCYPDQSDHDVRFPRLHPFKQPEKNPLDKMVTGWFSDSISSAIWLVFSVVALGFVLFFFVLLGVVMGTLPTTEKGYGSWAALSATPSHLPLLLEDTTAIAEIAIFADLLDAAIHCQSPWYY